MEIYKNLKRIRRNAFLLGTVIPFILGAKTKTEELKHPIIEQTLEQKISQETKSSTNKINIIFDYKIGNEQKDVDYLTSKTAFIQNNGYLWRESNIPELSIAEGIQVENIMNDIKNKNINSYQELVEISKNFSENQKLVLLSAIGNSLNIGSYDVKLRRSEVVSQDIFFSKLQNFLESGNQDGLGDCKAISYYLEQLANDTGVKVKVAVSTGIVEGDGHSYTVLKTKDGSAIVDSYNILITNTKNIEKTLEAYQKYQGTTTFQHLFFEDTKFKYRLITKDGRNFLNFLGYDESSEQLKNVLINHDSKDYLRDSRIVIDFGKYLSSLEFNYKDFFAKVGEIRGSLSSPMDKMTLFQTSYDRKFLISDIININPDISLMYGKISQDAKINDELLGITGNLIVDTNNEKGLNLSSRISGNAFTPTMEFAIFHDVLFGIGVSYKIPIKNMSIEPYAIMQYGLFPENLDTYNFRPIFSEFNSGIIFDINVSDNIDISLNPYYTWRIWENGFGNKVEFGNRNVKANIEGYITKSKYDFNPDKRGLKIGLEANLKNFGLEGGYERKETNYDGEKEKDNSLNASINIKY